MNRKTFYSAIVLFLFFLLTAQGCVKKKEDTDNNTCRTCKAFAAPDKPEATQEVCSDAEEADFRASHTGQEISCH